MSNFKNSAPAMRPVKNEFIVTDLDDEDGDEMSDPMVDSGEANRSNVQLNLCTDEDVDDDWDTKIDNQYMKLLDSFREDGDSYLSDNPLRSIRYDVDNGSYDKRKFKGAVTENQQRRRRSREDRKTTRVQEAELRRRRESLVKRNSSQRNVEASEKESSDGVRVLDENYRSYLTWLVENSKTSRTRPEKEIPVKREEEYTMSLSDSGIIAVEDHPFLDEEDSPFVPSKNYEAIDVEEENGDQRPSWFRKEIIKVLKQPYNEEEYMELNCEASVRRLLTRCRELRDGRELTYTTKEMKPSYLDMYPDFKKKYEESIRENDRHKALNLLRGFIFYLMKVACDDAFQPWLDPECLKIRCF